MGISGISFLVEMDRPFDKISPDTKPFFPILMRCGDGTSQERTMYFGSFDLSVDADGENTIYVEAQDPRDIDENLIEDYPTVSDFQEGKIFEFVARCGDEENEIYPVKITGLTLYQNGYRHDMSDEVCNMLTSALHITKSKDRIPNSDALLIPTRESTHSIENVDGKIMWVPKEAPKAEEKSMTKDEAINTLQKLAIWEVDEEGEEFYKVTRGHIKPGFSLNLGEFYFGNDMYTVEAKKSEDGQQTIQVDLYRPKDLVGISKVKEDHFEFPEDDISELVDKHLFEKPVTTAVILPDAEKINPLQLEKMIITELYNQGFIDEKNIPAYEAMKKNRSGFYQQFQRKYDRLEDISLHRLSFPEELVNKPKLNPDEVSELGDYYYKLANLTATPGQELPERNLNTVIEMIKDGIPEKRIGTIFLHINRRMDLGPRNNCVPAILRHPNIKAMLEGQKAAKSREFNR